MANAFLNPVSVPGMWGDPIPAPAPHPTRMVETSAATEMAAETNALATRPKAIAWVKMAPDILRAMSMAAHHASRTVGEVWAEAAREWLLRKSLDADYDVLSNLPARRKEAAALAEKRSRMWGAVDTAMADLRPAQRVGWGA